MLKTIAVALSAAVLCSAQTAWSEEPEICAEAYSQSEMNACAAELAREAEREMERVLAEVRAATENARHAQLDAAQEAWVVYRDAQCAFDAGQFEGGTMQPLVASMCRAQLAAQRTEALLASRPEAK